MLSLANRTSEQRCRARYAALSSSGSRSFGSDRIEDGDVLLREAKENGVAIAEVMIDPHLETVRVVSRRANLREVVCRITREIRRRRVGVEETLHGRKDQRLRNLETRSADRLILLPLSIKRQWSAGRVATKFIPHKIIAHEPR